MVLHCKQVTVTSALEFTLFYQGCPLKQSAGYNVGKLERLENTLPFNSIGPIDRREKMKSGVRIATPNTQKVFAKRDRKIWHPFKV